MGKFFGTDGFRGEVNSDLTAAHAYKIGRFLGYYFSKEHKAKIVIGKDTRISGYMLESALISGLTCSGADVYLLHVSPTPSVAYITRTDKFDCGIMISASHNVFSDNGIKLLNKAGEKMEDSLISLVEEYIDDKYSEDIPLLKKEKIGKVFDYSIGREKYKNYLLSLNHHPFTGYKVGLDLANGASYFLAEEIFKTLGAKTYVINNTPNGTNINNNCGSTHIENLQKFVLDNHLDCGFAFDGDADRCLAVSDTGEVINGDQIIYLYASYMKKRNRLTNDEVVTTVMSNIGLYQALDKLDIKHYATAVGDKNVHDYMAIHHNLIGGEQSGHIIFSKYATTGDGMLTALKVMQAIISQKEKLSSLVSGCKMFPQTLINVRVKDKKVAMEDKDILALCEEINRSLNGSGRILVRASGTEPLIRVMVEAESKETCDRECKRVVSLIETKGYKAE